VAVPSPSRTRGSVEYSNERGTVMTGRTKNDLERIGASIHLELETARERGTHNSAFRKEDPFKGSAR
jgi:hypothetical protein